MDRKTIVYRLIILIFVLGVAVGVVWLLAYFAKDGQIQEAVLGDSAMPIVEDTPVLGVVQPMSTKSSITTPEVPTSLLPQVPPTCEFGGQPVESIGITLTSMNTFTFSEPMVVLTDDMAIGIKHWLPDGQRLLITRELPEHRQSIELFNVATGETQVYATREYGGHLAWLDTLQAVVYVERRYVDRNAGLAQYDLWFSQGDPEGVQKLAENVLPFSVAIDANDQVSFFSATTNQLQNLDMTHKTIQSLPLDLTSWLYTKYPESVEEPKTMSSLYSFRLVQSPDNSILAASGDPWLYLIETQSGKVCEIELGYMGNIPHHATGVTWSPNAQYLAMKNKVSLPGELLPFSALTVLDVTQAKLFTMDITPEHDGSWYHLTDLAWSPNSQYLAILNDLGISQTEGVKSGLFIIDVISKQIQLGLSSYDLGGGEWGAQLAWDLTGEKLIINCPTKEFGQICLVTLTHK